MTLEDHFQVTPDQLRAAGQDLLDIADRLHVNAAELSGEQDSISGAGHGFETMTAAAECENGWQQAVEVIGSKLATGADILVLNAASYADGETRQANKFRAN